MWNSPRAPLPSARPRTLPLLALLALACGGLAACGGNGAGGGATFVAERTIHLPLDAKDTKLLDLRFRAAEIRLRQSAEPEIFLDGTVRVTASDRDEAEIHAASLDVRVTAGRFTRLELPEPPPGCSYAAKFELVVPIGLNVVVVLGEGSFHARVDPPLKLDVQVGVGHVELEMPPSASAFVLAEMNVGEIRFDDRGFAISEGTPVREFTRSVLQGSIGAPPPLVGNRVEVRVNAGLIDLLAEGSALAKRIRREAAATGMATSATPGAEPTVATEPTSAP